MPRLRKLRKRQKFQFNRNRQRVRKTQEKTKNENVRVNCEVLKSNWDARKPVKQNMEELGIAYNPNKIMSIPSTKQQLVQRAKGQLTENDERTMKDEQNESEVIKKLKEETKVEKKQKFRFKKDEINWMVHMMDKYGDDFEKMSRDPKNLFQLTPNQIKHKIVKFINIPEQFAPIAKERGLLDYADKLDTE